MLDELYREIILDHYTRPRNRGRLEPADIVIEGANPSCGDEISVYARVEDGVIQDIRFEGRGCSISQASASMMTERVRGRSLEEVKALIEEFKGMMQGGPAEEDRLGDLVALQGVRKFPVRVKCATLAWVALLQGVREYESGRRAVVTASTEDDL
ncbi:MAG: SUF system NifU family Fe-S cluster assembly protein [Armatimonadota bacterium]|nr:SUF system NifU family Fe-S cluster assembly protein [Armatimonadota bacterium]MDR7439786.1 SUF system NifU family Fe-S cluster assembly protein [Armatimonadota bacterium]MDR7562199.1 SUF system NifU family Fe-S cluster assembly protein [Armatimonadota bacterium]MDR7567715.1 SUF system NifU family Fe-S cluster assembly protein [Armatimonadota bacterium]MDR7602807.1 SUF system NifU family Fe-S cluster assembly protein [Armatimonadota bacterium]